jgi:hypothetical protein
MTGAVSPVPERPVLLVSAPFRNDDRAREDWAAMVHLAAWAEGHGSCGGWQFATETSRVVCACEAVLFDVTDPATGSAVTA